MKIRIIKNREDIKTNMSCKECFGTLVLGNKEGINKIWCPKCAGLKTYNSEESRRLIISTISRIKQEIEKILIKYNKDSLISTLMATREGSLIKTEKEGIMNPTQFISISLLIRDIIKNNKNFGNNDVDFKGNDFQSILHLNEHLITLEKFIWHIINGFVIFVEIPNKKLPEFSCEYDKNIKYNIFEDLASTKNKETSLNFKFTKKWLKISENLRKSGLMTNIDVEEISRNLKEEQILDFVRQLVSNLMGIELASPDFDILRFTDIKKNKEYIGALYKIIQINYDNLIVEEYKNQREYTCSLKPGDLVKFFSSFHQYGLDMKKAINLFTFNELDIKGFPLIYMSLQQRKIYIPPYTLKWAYNYLNAKFIIDKGTLNSQKGSEFEKFIASKLPNKGFSINTPNDCTKTLMNIKDDYEKPTLEIDILAYKDDIIYIIDCKNFLLTYDLLLDKRKQVIEKKFKDINFKDKQDRRVDFVKNNLSKWGFSKKKFKKIKSAIVTFFDEPLEKFDKSHLIPEDKLEKLMKISDFFSI